MSRMTTDLEALAAEVIAENEAQGITLEDIAAQVVAENSTPDDMKMLSAGLDAGSAIGGATLGRNTQPVQGPPVALAGGQYRPETAPVVPQGMTYGGYLPGQVAPRDAYAAAKPPTVSLMPGGDGQIANIVRGLDRGVNVAGTQIGGAMAAAGNFLPGTVGRQLVTQGEDYAAQQAMMRDQTAPTTTFLGGVAEAVPGLVGAIGTGLATGGVAPALGLGAGLVGTAAGATVAGVQSGGGQYVDAMERLQNRGIVGETAREQAAASAAGTGAVSAVTSVIPMGRYLSRFIPATVASGVMGRIATTRAGRIVMDAAAEGSQEAVEELGSMVAQDMAENDPNAYNEFAPRLAQAFGAGAVLGGVVGGAMDVATGGGPESRARQAAAMRARSAAGQNEQTPGVAQNQTTISGQPDANRIGSQSTQGDPGATTQQGFPQAAAGTAGSNQTGESQSGTGPTTTLGEEAGSSPNLTPEAQARINALYDQIMNRPDMPDAERVAMETEMARLAGDTEDADATQPSPVEPAPVPVAAADAVAVAGGGSVAAPTVGTAEDGLYSVAGGQSRTPDVRAGGLGADGRVLADGTGVDRMGGRGVGQDAVGVAGSGGMLPERAAAVTGTNNLTRKEVPNGEERQGRQEVLNPAARSSDTRPLAIADMTEAQLRARAAELGLNAKGAIGAVRRRLQNVERATQSQSPASLDARTPESPQVASPVAPVPALASAAVAVPTSEAAQTTNAAEGSASQNPTPTRAPLADSASWMIVEKSTGRVVMETFDRRAAAAVNQEKYEAVPVEQYLKNMNRRIAEPAAPPTPTPAPAASAAPSAPARPTPAQEPAPAPAQPPASSQRRRTQGGSATAATGTTTATAAASSTSARRSVTAETAAASVQGSSSPNDTDPEIARVAQQVNAPIRAVAPKTPRQRQLAERLGKLGTRVVIVDDPTKSFKGFAGNSRERRSVYIASDIDDAKLASVFAHEVFHTLVRQNPDFREQVAGILGEERVARGERDYRAELAASSLGGGGILEAFDTDADLRREEGIAKALEDAAAGDLEAARRLYETPGLLARLRQLFNNALERIGIERATPERRALNAMFDRIGVNGERAQQRSIAWAQSKGGTTMEVRRRFARTPEYEMGVNARGVATMQTDDWSGSMERMFSFPGDKLPADVRRALEGAPLAVRRLFQTGVPSGRGPDAFAMLGEDGYMAVARAEAGLDDRGGQIDALRENPDPENQYVAAVAQAARETGKNTTKTPIAANALQPGDVFRVNGKPVRVLRDENERMVLVGRPFRGILVEGLTTIPIDTGTHYREGSRGNVQTVQEMGSEAADVPSESRGFVPSDDVPFSPRSMFDRTDDAKGTGGGQGSLFGIPANARATEPPKLTLAERRELYPGIKPNETTAQYEKRMGTADTPMMFSPAGKGDQDGTAKGPFGPIYTRFVGRYRNALNFLRRTGDGEALAVLTHPDIDGPIALVYGKKGTAASNFEDGFGIAKIDHKHPGALDKLPTVWDSLAKSKKQTDPQNRVVLSNGEYRAVVGIRFQDRKKVWLVTAFEKETAADAARTVPVRDNPKAGETPSPSAAANDTPPGDIRFAPRGMSRIEQRNQERADRKIGTLEKKVDTEREKAESAKAAARATISVLQTQLKAAMTREKGLSKVVGILETMRARQETRADEATAENQARAEAMKQMRATQREVEQVKDELVRIVRDALPKSMHGAFVTDIRKIRSRQELPGIVAKIEQASQLYRAKELDRKLSDLTGVRDTRKLDNPKVRDYVVGARGKNGALKALTESSNTRDVAKKAMRDFVESAKAFMDSTTASQRQTHIVEMENAYGQLVAAVEAQKAEDKLVEKNRMRAISDIATQVVERLASMPVGVIVRTTSQKFGNAANHGILWVTGLDNIGNMIDGTRTDIGGGTFSQTIVRPIQEGQNQAAKQVKQAKDMADEAAQRNGLGSLAEAFATLFGSMGDANTAKYKLTIPIGGKTELRAHEALKLAAMDQETLGHVIGLDRPLFWDADGSGFTVSWQQYDALMKVIPANHLAFVQELKAIRDLGFDAMASEVKKLTGTEPPKVFGYDKITVHPDVSAKWKVEDSASLLPTGHITQSLENLGITKARESNNAAMLVTNFGEDWLQTVDTQARVTHLAAPIRNMKELLRRDDVKLAIKSRISPYAIKRLETIADDVGGTGARGGREGGEFTRRWLKYSANKNKALTALNLASVARNGAGVMTLLAEMDVRVWTEGIARVMSLQSDSLVDLMDKSDLVTRFYGQSVVALQTIQTQGSMAADAGRDRAGSAWEQFVRGGKASGKSAARAVADLRGLRLPGRRVGAVADFFRGLLDAASNAGTMFDGINMIHYVSTLPARIAWEGYKAEAARRGESEAWAIQQTERAVGRTQAVPDPAELTALQSFARGTPLQPFTSFGTDAARMVNMILRAKITGKRRGATAAAVMMAGLWSGAVTGLFSKELLQVLFGTDDEEDRRNLWQKAAADAVRDSIGGSVPGISDRFVEAVKAYYTVRTPGAAEGQLLETPVSSGITNFAGGIGLLVSAVDEAVEGNDNKGRTPGEKALKSAEMMLTEMLEASGVPLPSVYRQGKRVVTAATEKKTEKK